MPQISAFITCLYVVLPIISLPSFFPSLVHISHSHWMLVCSSAVFGGHVLFSRLEFIWMAVTYSNIGSLFLCLCQAVLQISTKRGRKAGKSSCHTREKFAGKNFRKHKAVKGWPEGEFPIYSLCYLKWIFPSLAKLEFWDFFESIERICKKGFSAGCKLVMQFTEDSSVNNQYSTKFFSASFFE